MRRRSFLALALAPVQRVVRFGMPDTYTREYYFEGGVNNTYADELIQDNELADARNLIPKTTGGGNLIKRCGVKAVSSGAAYTGATNFVSRPSVYCGKNGNYFSDCWVAGETTTFNIYTAANGTVRYTDTTQVSTYPAWTSFSTYDIYTDGAHAVKTNNGTSFTAIANFPTGGHSATTYNNYLFCLVGNTLRWSAQSDCETWPADHSLPIVLAGQSDALSALAKVGEELVVFSQENFYCIQGYGDLDFTITKKYFGVGCSMNLLTRSTPYGLFWWNPMYGLVSTKDGTSVDYPMMRKLASTFAANDYYTMLYGSMIWRPECLALSVYMNDDGSATNTALRVDYYPLKDAFFIHNGAASTVAAAGADDGITTSNFAGATVYVLYMDIADKLYCRQEDETIATDMGSAFTCYLYTKRRSDPFKSYQKSAKNVLITTKFPSASNMTYSVFQDNATSATQTKTLTQNNATVTDNFVTINQQHRKIQHYLADSVNGRTEYYGIVENGIVDKVL